MSAKHGMTGKVRVDASAVFAVRLLKRMASRAKVSGDGVELTMTPQDCQAVIESMERDGISVAAQDALVTAEEAAEVERYRPRDLN